MVFLVFEMAQAALATLLSLGAYTFSTVAEHVFSHFTFRKAALLGISSVILISSGSNSCLLMTKHTPAIAWGLSGCVEFRIFRFFSKFHPSISVISWSRCDSCMASITIFSVCIVWLIVPHFSLQFMFSEGAAAPLTFWEEIHILALSLAFFRGSFVFSLPWFSGLILGVGWVQLFWVLGAHWVLCYASMWACALVRFTWFRVLSGMGMHSWHWGGAKGHMVLFIYNGLGRRFRLYTFYVSKILSMLSSNVCQGGNALNYKGTCLFSAGKNWFH
jgi:hypothetical protein